uniref:UBX domain protein 10 n=1 Tax=Amphilophus citrinellus TaxID=61819 RepID=A0A3Q0SII4_AMPCI
MHLTRPKSSKGRKRPAVNNSVYPGEADSFQRQPESRVCRRPDGSLRSRSQPVMLQANQLSQEDVLYMLHHAPAARLQSFNKYKVLPSIERRRQSEASLHKDMSNLNLADDDGVTQISRPEVDTVSARPHDPAPEAGSGSLLLAIRAPCGRRFQQLFDPTHTLLTVRASAEARFGATYEAACVETMEVPRRTFTDLNMTLAQCGIPNRSVLCISQENDIVEGEQE